MTVKELIEKLQQYEDHMEVEIYLELEKECLPAKTVDLAPATERYDEAFILISAYE